MMTSPRLSPEEVHIWTFSLRRSADEVHWLRTLLSKDEQDRIEQYRTLDLRTRAVAARGVLRLILSSYLACPPERVSFDYGPQGKPALPNERLQFNLSHSGGHAVCGVALDVPLGVDLEHIRCDIEHAELARTTFSTAEIAALATYSAAEARRGFFRCWALKEAYIKARGGGLSIPLDAFDVPLRGPGRLEQVVSREPVDEAHGWFVQELDCNSEVAAAVCVRGPRWTFRVRPWGSLSR